MPGNSRVAAKKSKLEYSSENSSGEEYSPEPTRRGRPKKSQNSSIKDNVNAKENIIKNSKKKSLAKEPQRPTSSQLGDVEDGHAIVLSEEESNEHRSRNKLSTTNSISSNSKLLSGPSTNNKNVSSSKISNNKDKQASKSADSMTSSVVGPAEKNKQTGRLNTTSSSTIVQRKHGSQNNNNSTMTRIKNSAVRSGSGFIRVSVDERKNKEAGKAKKVLNVEPVDWTIIHSSESEIETSPKVTDSKDKTHVLSEKEDKTEDNNSEISNLNNNNNSDNNESSPSPPLPLSVAPETNNNLPLSTTANLEATVQAIVDENLEEYKSLTNAEEDYLKVPVLSSPVSFSFPQDQQWENICPGVLMSSTFNNSDVKTGYLRIACRTIKPFEKTTNSEITYAVMEGAVAVKYAKVDFTETGDAFLEPAEVGTGGHIYVPQNAIYSLENWSDEAEVSLYYCIIRV